MDRIRERQGRSAEAGDVPVGSWFSTMAASRFAGFLRVALVVLVVLAPLPLGANRPWSWSLLVLVVCSLLLGDAVRRMVNNDPAKTIPGRLVVFPAILYLLAGTWAAWQATSAFPTAWVHPIWATAEQALGVALAGRGAVEPDSVWTSLMKAAAYAGIFWLACQFYRNPRHARRALDVIFCAILAYALFALISQETGQIIDAAGKVSSTRVSGTYPNPNHFGIYLGFGILIGMARVGGRLTLILDERADWRARVRDILLFAFGRGSFYSGGILVLVVTLIQTASRGAAIAATVGACVLAGLYLARHRQSLRGAGAGLLAIAGLAITGLSLVAADGLSRRLVTAGADFESLRIPTYEMALAMIADRPLLGHGLGAFRPLSESYRNFPDSVTMNDAHNEFLETAVELGIPGAVVFIAAILWIVYVCLAGVFRRRRDAELPLLGACAGVMLGIHSLVDFSLQIPAIATTFAMILGLAFANAWPERKLGSAGVASRAARGDTRMSDGAAVPTGIDGRWRRLRGD